MAQTASTTNNYYGSDKGGHIRLISDTVANDIDKTLTVPSGALWQVLHAYCEWTSDANAGDRQVELQVRDASDDVIAVFPALNVQASGATEYYLWGVSGDLTETKAGYHYLPLAPTVLAEGYDLRIHDSATIAATDDTVVHALVLEYTTR